MREGLRSPLAASGARRGMAVDPIRTIKGVALAFDEQFGKVSSFSQRRGHDQVVSSESRALGGAPEGSAHRFGPHQTGGISSRRASALARHGKNDYNWIVGGPIHSRQCS